LCLGIAFAAYPAPVEAAGAPTLDAYRRGLEIVERSFAAIGGSAAFESAGGITLHGTGTFDLGTRLQGMSAARSEPYPLAERFTIDTAGTRAAYQSDTRVNADAREILRYLFAPGRPLLLADFGNNAAYWLTGVDVEDDLGRYARMVPHLLIRDALRSRATIRYLGRQSLDGLDREVVSFSLPDGETLSVFVDPGTWRPVAVEYLLDMPLLGDTVVRWRYDAWRDVAGLGAYPQGYQVELGARMLKKVRYDFIRAGVDNDLLTLPGDLDVPPPPSEEPVQRAAPRGLPAARRVAEGAYIVPNIRSGFHPLIVEFSEFLVVIDAPTGWFELHQLPARNWSAGETSSSVSRRLLDVARRDFPAKPVRYLVLTHHHSDHAGGVRPFLAAGATVIAAPETLPVVDRAAAARVTLNPDELTGREAIARNEPVTAERRVFDETNEVRIINVGPNPHVEGMLVVWLPKQKLLYQSDLFSPAPIDSFPQSARVPVMKWFVDWLDGSGLHPDQIRAMHGSGAVTPQHLDIIRKWPVNED
jgi:glyoxylase-like metal-dependent hydrolase (beta-lactamase superfamily II)